MEPAVSPAAARVLEGLREVPLPPPVPYRPDSAAWAVLAGIVLAVLGLGLWRWAVRRRRNRYRVLAGRELQDIRTELEQQSTRVPALQRLPALVKRVVLAFAPRQQVASLTGPEWLALLDRTYPPAGFSDGPGRLLLRLAYEPPERLAATPDQDLTSLLALLQRWITHHHARL